MFQQINDRLASSAFSKIIEVEDTRVQRADPAEYQNVRAAFRTRNHQITINDRLGLWQNAGWHGLGEVTEEGLSPTDAVKRYLGFWVEEHPVYAKIDGKETVLPAKITVRSDTREIMGMVSIDYVVMQNLAIGQFAEALVGEDVACQMETCGSLLGGRKVFLLLRVPAISRVGKTGADVTVPYLMLASAHDGSMAFSALWTRQRVVCNNSNTTALSGIDGKVERGEAFRIRHTANMVEAVNEARKVLGIAAKGVARNNAEDSALSQHFLKPDGRTDYFRTVYASIYGPVDEKSTKEQDEAARMRRDRIIGEWTTLSQSESNTFDGIGGTAWSMYNAVTEWMDWTRCGTRMSEDRADHSRVLGVASVAKRKARRAAVALLSK